MKKSKGQMPVYLKISFLYINHNTMEKYMFILFFLLFYEKIEMPVLLFS